MMKHSREPRDGKQLRQAMEHVIYEIDMLRATANRIRDTRDADRELKNALLESFGIHARALYFFFFAYDPREDDVVASDFCEPPSSWSLTEPQELKDLKRRVDKEIAHITYDRLTRVSPEEKEWNIPVVYNTLVMVIKEFCGIARGEFIPERLRHLPIQSTKTEADTTATMPLNPFH